MDLRVVHAVCVRREDTGRQGRRVDAVVEDRERLRDGPLAAGIGRPVQQLAVEGHRRRAAGVKRGRRDAAQAHHRQRQLEVGQAGAVSGLPAVDGNEQDPAVGRLADPRARMAVRELIRRESFE